MYFFPLIILGYWKLFTEDTDSKDYKRNSNYLVLGYSGLIQSHILSCAMIIFPTVFTCLIMIRQVKRKKTFLQLVKAVGQILILNAWFIIPFIDYSLSEKFNVTNDLRLQNMIQVRGVQINDFVQSFANTNGRSFGTGLQLIVCGCLFILIWLLDRRHLKHNPYFKLGEIGFAFTVVFGFMASMWFPWDILQKASQKISLFATSLQVPSRFMVLPCISLTVVGCVVVTIVKEKSRRCVRGLTLSIGCIAVLSSMFFYDTLPAVSQIQYVYDIGGIGFYFSGEEYLPFGCDLDRLVGKDPVCSSEDLVYSYYEKKYLHIEMDCQNNGGDGYIDLPLLFYKGYVAKDSQGNSLTISRDDNYCIRVIVPEGFCDKITLDFVSPWYWRVAEVVSAFMLIYIAIYYCTNLNFIQKNAVSMI